MATDGKDPGTPGTSAQARDQTKAQVQNQAPKGTFGFRIDEGARNVILRNNLSEGMDTGFEVGGDGIVMEGNRARESSPVTSAASNWEQIEPLVSLLKRAEYARNRLSKLAYDMEKNQPRNTGTTAKTFIQKSLEEAAGNAALFETFHRPDLVKLVADLSSQHGILDPRVNQLTLCERMTGPSTVRPMIEGLNEICSKLSETIAIKATSLP